MNPLVRNLLAVLLPLMLAATVAEAGNPAGFVVAVRSDAQVVRAGQSHAAVLGMQLLEGDRLRTGRKGRIKVLLSDDTVLALGSATEVVVTKHLFDSAQGQRSTRLELVGGTLRSLVAKMVGKGKADFEVRARNAVAGVRGTEFVIQDTEGETRVCAFSGEVDLGGADGRKVVVAAGEGSRVGGGGTSQPEKVAAAEITRLRAETDSQQSPTALAWNVQLGRGDRLPGSVRTGAGQGSLQTEVAPPEENVPCPGCGGAARSPGSAHSGVGGGGNSFTFPGDEGDFKFNGDWESDTVIESGRGSAVKVTITIRR